MQRGVLMGILLGSVVSIAVLAALSLSTPLPGERAGAVAPAQADAEPATTGGEAEGATGTEVAAETASQEAQDTAETADAETADTDTPVADTAAPEDAVAVEAPPAAPPADPGTVETALAAPSRLPQISDTDGTNVGGAPETADTPARAVTRADALPQISGARDAAPLTDTAPAPEPAIGAAPASPTGPDVATGEPRVGGGTDAAPAATAPTAPAGGAQATAPQSIDTTTPAAPAPETASETAETDTPEPRSGRLATVGRNTTGTGTQPERSSSFIPPAAPEDTVSGEGAPEADTQGDADLADAPESEVEPNALRDNAQAFDAPETARAFMSVVLIDDPENPLDDDALSRLDFPLAFAIDPLHPDAGARAETLRAAGYEVVILGTMIPSGATSADTDAALLVATETLPQAVAVLDTPDSRIQGDRAVLAATVDALVRSGHGLLTLPRGLNPAEAIARRADLPAATAYRALDTDDERATVITRTLTRAAITASQQGGVVVIGRTRPDTITALLSWSGQREAESVTLAPVSALLLQSVN